MFIHVLLPSFIQRRMCRLEASFCHLFYCLLLCTSSPEAGHSRQHCCTPFWTNDRLHFHPFKSIDLGGSFTDAPKRSTDYFNPPTTPPARLIPTHSFSPTRGFSLFGESTLPSLA
ncbi:hypothetical protein AVEN_113736-1 [Araneus ventricosus]|uniref:Uncharacterized protein n=1 Tax=Araneus ventricosus TaxID=182803 RepID=A0A4Y2QUC4_ARAVE|nr:hypothetical protein AVEN_113736-1 [Araneus ventricosus]